MEETLITGLLDREIIRWACTTQTRYSNYLPTESVAEDVVGLFYLVWSGRVQDRFETVVQHQPYVNPACSFF